MFLLEELGLVPSVYTTTISSAMMPPQAASPKALISTCRNAIHSHSQLEQLSCLVAVMRAFGRTCEDVALESLGDPAFVKDVEKLGIAGLSRSQRGAGLCSICHQ